MPPNVFLWVGKIVRRIHSMIVVGSIPPRAYAMNRVGRSPKCGFDEGGSWERGLLGRVLRTTPANDGLNSPWMPHIDSRMRWSVRRSTGALLASSGARFD